MKNCCISPLRHHPPSVRYLVMLSEARPLVGVNALSFLQCFDIVTFRVRCCWGDMYIGHGCLCVCLSLAACPHYCTDPGVSWGMVWLPSSCALLGRFAIGARVLLLWQHSAECEMSTRACTRSMPGWFGERNGIRPVKNLVIRRRMVERTNWTRLTWKMPLKRSDDCNAAVYRTGAASTDAIIRTNTCCTSQRLASCLHS